MGVAVGGVPVTVGVSALLGTPVGKTGAKVQVGSGSGVFAIVGGGGKVLMGKDVFVLAGVGVTNAVCVLNKMATRVSTASVMETSGVLALSSAMHPEATKESILIKIIRKILFLSFIETTYFCWISTTVFIVK